METDIQQGNITHIGSYPPKSSQSGVKRSRMERDVPSSSNSTDSDGDGSTRGPSSHHSIPSIASSTADERDEEMVSPTHTTSSSRSNSPDERPNKKNRRETMVVPVRTKIIQATQQVDDTDDDEPMNEQKAQPKNLSAFVASSAQTEIHCGLLIDGKRKYREANKFFASIVSLGQSETTISQPSVNVYTAAADGHRRTLYCCGDLAKRFEATNDTKRMNKVGMWMSRRRHVSGVFQASAILHKEQGPQGRAGLKSSGYFFTIEIAELYEQHVLNARVRTCDGTEHGKRPASKNARRDASHMTRRTTPSNKMHPVLSASSSRECSPSGSRSHSGSSSRAASPVPDASASLLHAMSAAVAMVASDEEDHRQKSKTKVEPPRPSSAASTKPRPVIASIIAPPLPRVKVNIPVGKAIPIGKRLTELPPPLERPARITTPTPTTSVASSSTTSEPTPTVALSPPRSSSRDLPSAAQVEYERQLQLNVELQHQLSVQERAMAEKMHFMPTQQNYAWTQPFHPQQQSPVYMPMNPYGGYGAPHSGAYYSMQPPPPSYRLESDSHPMHGSYMAGSMPSMNGSIVYPVMSNSMTQPMIHQPGLSYGGSAGAYSSFPVGVMTGNNTSRPTISGSMTSPPSMMPYVVPPQSNQFKYIQLPRTSANW